MDRLAEGKEALVTGEVAFTPATLVVDLDEVGREPLREIADAVDLGKRKCGAGSGRSIR